MRGTLPRFQDSAAVPFLVDILKNAEEHPMVSWLWPGEIHGTRLMMFCYACYCMMFQNFKWIHLRPQYDIWFASRTFETIFRGILTRVVKGFAYLWGKLQWDTIWRLLAEGKGVMSRRLRECSCVWWVSDVVRGFWSNSDNAYYCGLRQCYRFPLTLKFFQLSAESRESISRVFNTNRIVIVARMLCATFKPAITPNMECAQRCGTKLLRP